MTKWKYGTILHDTDYDRKLMVTRLIPEQVAGEDDLFEAIGLDDDDEHRWYAVKPGDKGLDVIEEGIVVTWRSLEGTVTGAWLGGQWVEATEDEEPGERLAVSWDARGVFTIT